jgi:predicted outer membrane repeat protein
MKKTNPQSFLRLEVWRRRLCLLVFGICGAVLCRIPAVAQTCNYTVTSFADSGTGSLRAGLADPSATDICFASSGTIALASSLQIATSVTIDDSVGVTISGNNQFQIFVVPVSDVPVTVQINGLTLTKGSAGSGGALWVQQGVVTLTGTKINNNSAGSGGGVYNQGTLTLSRCAISNNTAINGSGGGIENIEGASLTLQDSTVTGNVDSASPGGGVDNGGTLTITGGTFSGNQATQGGAIYNNGFYASMNDSPGTLFSSNTASSDGGAIYNNQGYFSVMAALFTGNSSQSSAASYVSCGGAICNVGTAYINESTFTTNTTNGSGGAIQNYSSGYLYLEDDTITGNTATGSGSGLDIASTAIPTINNTIISENTAIAGAANSDCNGCAASNGVANLIGVTVNLGPLALNGGPTQTMMPLPGSPAINAGNPAPPGTEGFDTTDQRGFSRLSPSGGLDIGAVQTHYSSVSFLTQPVNTLFSKTITPAVAVQVVEVDNTTTNYPLGVPVTVSLETTQGVPVTGALTGTLTQSPTVSSGVTSAVFPDLAVNTAGTYKLFATTAISGNSASADPAYSSASSTFQITRATPVLTWATPAPIFTTTALSATQLDATAAGITGAALPGTFVYKPAAGATLAAGTQVLTTTFTPADAVNYNTASAQVTIQVNYPPADISVTVPSTPASGEQPGITIVLNSPYSSDLNGALGLTFAPQAANGVDDPAVQFATGGRTSTFTVPAGSTTIPAVTLQTGTVAGTITVTLALTTGGVDVTPPGVSPITLVIAPAAPVITSVKFTNNSTGLITVAINGFSNTRDMTQTTFVFTGNDAQSLGSAQVQIPVSSLFSPWYSSSASDQYGSEFTYTQNFQLSKPDANITGVSVTLANSIGTSGSVNSQ